MCIGATFLKNWRNSELERKLTSNNLYIQNISKAETNFSYNSLFQNVVLLEKCLVIWLLIINFFCIFHWFVFFPVLIARWEFDIFQRNIPKLVSCDSDVRFWAFERICIELILWIKLNLTTKNNSVWSRF